MREETGLLIGIALCDLALVGFAAVITAIAMGDAHSATDSLVLVAVVFGAGLVLVQRLRFARRRDR